MFFNFINKVKTYASFSQIVTIIIGFILKECFPNLGLTYINIIIIGMLVKVLIYLENLISYINDDETNGQM